MTIEGLIITKTQGRCPLSINGTMDGFPFFFRITHASWTLTIVPTEQDPFDAWISAHLDGKELSVYQDAELHDCGKTSEVEAGVILGEAYQKFCKMLSV